MATAADHAIVDKAVKKALEEIQARAPTEFKQITAEPKQLEELKLAAHKAAEEQDYPSSLAMACPTKRSNLLWKDIFLKTRLY